MRTARVGKGLLWIVAAVTAVAGIGSAYADEAPTHLNATRADKICRKLGRGAANVIMAPLELVRTPTLVGRRDGYPAALTVGLCQGVWHVFQRAGVGVVELVTFFVPLPKDYGPILKPEFVWANGMWSE